MNKNKTLALALCDELRECIRFRKASTAARTSSAIALFRRMEFGGDIITHISDVEAGIKEWFSPRYWRRGNEGPVFRANLFYTIATLEDSIEMWFAAQRTQAMPYANRANAGETTY